MRYPLLLTLGAALVMPSSSVAQQWTPEQQEVWEFELRCFNMMTAERVAQCFHMDYTGWNARDPLPLDWQAVKDASSAFEESTFVSARPLSIKIYGDVAVVHYMSYWRDSNADGTTTLRWARWTDVAMKEGGRWTWIADAGGPVSIYSGGASPQ